MEYCIIKLNECLKISGFELKKKFIYEFDFRSYIIKRMRN